MKTSRRLGAIVLVLLWLLLLGGVAQASTLTLPTAIKDILTEAFYGDTSLDEVVIPEGCTSIGDRAFANCQISKVVLPSTLAYISPTAFDGNPGMKVVAEIGTYAYDWAFDKGFVSFVSAVSNLQALIYEKSITLFWDSTTGADGYRISEKTSGNNIVLGTVSNDTFYEIANVSVGTHTYIVEAYKNVNGTKAYGAPTQVSVNVSNIFVETIQLNRSYIELEIDQTVTLQATVSPASADNKAITWRSDNTDVVSVSTAGKVTAISSGTATITATSKDGSGVTASCVVEVKIDAPYLTVTHPTIGDVLNAGEIEMFNGAAHQTWILNSNYSSRIEKVGDWFTLSASSFGVGENTLVLNMADGAPAGTKRTGKVRFYIDNSLFVTVNIYQDGGTTEDVTPDPTIAVHHPVLGDIFEAGTFEMYNGVAHQTWTVTSNCNWTITKSGSWFTVDKTSGSEGTTTVKLTMTDGAAAGETRNGSVTFKVNGSTYKTVNFKQVGAKKALTVTHELLGDIIAASPVAMYNGAAHQTWTVTSNADWTLKTTGTWYSVNKTSGSAGTSTIVLTFPDGADVGETRDGTIKFYFGSSLYATIRITQDGGVDTDPTASISVVHPWIGDVIGAGSANLTNSSGQSMNWTVFANYDWTITTSGSWFTVSPTSGSANEKTNVRITTTSYAPSGYNSGSIIFKKGSLKKATIKLYQGEEYDASDCADSFTVNHPYLGNVLDQDTIYMFNGSSYQTWSVVSNVDWSLTKSGSWFTVSPTSGSAKSATDVKLTFTSGVAAGESREGYVKFTYYINGKKKTSTVYIAQDGGPADPTPETSLAASHVLLGNVFEASPIEMHNSIGAEQNWTITSNKPWSIITSGSWFKVSPTSGSTNTSSNKNTNVKITITDYARPGNKNSGTITFYVDGSKYRTVSIYQDGGESISPSMTLGSSDFGDVFSSDVINLANERKTYTWSLQSNTAWSVAKSGSWFSISPTSGAASTDATTNFNITVNSVPAISDLTGSLTFKLNGNTFKTVSLKIPYNGTIAPTDDKLPAPTNFKVSVTNSTTSKLTWNNVSGASGFNVYRSTNAISGYTKLNSALVTSPYTDLTMKAGVNYYYTVEAVNRSGKSGSATVPYGPVSYNAACALSIGETSWAPSVAGASKNLIISKHGSNDYSVSVKQYNSSGKECTGVVTSTDHTLAKWLTATKSGTTLKLSAARNYAAAGKTAIVTVTCGCGATHTITVNQTYSEPAPANVTIKMDGYNGFTETSTVQGKATASHLDYVLIPGDTITVNATGGNYARRLTVRIINADNQVVTDEFNTTTGNTGLSKACSYVIPNKATGIYTVNVYASNSTTAGDDAQWISASAKIYIKPAEEEVQLLSKKDFMKKVAEMAVADYPNSRILPSVVTAQAILETGWGQSKIMMKANALFGVKATSSWKGGYYSTSTGEYYGEWTTVTALFRAYDSWEDCLADHASVLSAKRYSGVIGGTNYETVCNILQTGGYATDPEYASKLINIIESNGLDNYDKRVVSGNSQDSEVIKNRNDIVNHGKSWLSSKFSAYGVPYYKHGTTAKTVTETTLYYHGMPYVAGGKWATADGKAEDSSTGYQSFKNRTSLATYKGLSTSQRQQEVGRPYWYNRHATRSAYYGTECVGFVLQCWHAADSSVDVRFGISDTNCYVYSVKSSGDYSKAVIGDCLSSSGHVMLVIENDGHSITVIEQTATQGNGGFETCECAYCKNDSNLRSMGTRQKTYTYATLYSEGYNKIKRLSICMKTSETADWSK